MLEYGLVAILVLLIAVLFWKLYHPAGPSNGMLGDFEDDN